MPLQGAYSQLAYPRIEWFLHTAGAAVNIKKKGIKAVHFIENAERQLLDELDGRLSKAFSIDVLNSLPPKL